MNIEEVKENLEKKGYNVNAFNNKIEASEYLVKNIHIKTIGFGGSKTVEELDLINLLSKNNEVFAHYNLTGEEGLRIREKENTSEIYICSVNGMSKQGEIVNIDGVGNRLSSICFGHEKTYLIVGRNKITEDLDSAIYRARNIAAPKNAQRFGVKTPCAIKADKCYDCRSPQRICSGILILWKAMAHNNIEILLVDEDLGY